MGSYEYCWANEFIKMHQILQFPSKTVWLCPHTPTQGSCHTCQHIKLMFITKRTRWALPMRARQATILHLLLPLALLRRETLLPLLCLLCLLPLFRRARVRVLVCPVILRIFLPPTCLFLDLLRLCQLFHHPHLLLPCGLPFHLPLYLKSPCRVPVNVLYATATTTQTLRLPLPQAHEMASPNNERQKRPSGMKQADPNNNNKTWTSKQ